MIKRHTITIPGEPDSFNASLIDVDSHRKLLACRSGARTPLCFVDRNYSVIPGSMIDPGLVDNQDPRLFHYRDKYCRNRITLMTHYAHHRRGKKHFKVELSFINIDGRNISLDWETRYKFSEIYGRPKGIEGIQRQEKNWGPFRYGSDLMFVRSVSPHQILKFSPEDGRLRFAYQESWDHFWDDGGFGRDSWLRGNTPPVKLPDGSFLSTFHKKWRRKGVNRYYTSFYRFSGSPPFQVTHCTREPWINPEDATHWRRKLKCVFLVSMQIKDGVIELCGGDNDRKIRVYRIELKKVLSSLDPVLPKPFVLGWCI